MQSMSVTSTSTGVMWNGPICGTCGTRYLGSHACTAEDVQRKINELLALLNRLEKPVQPTDRVATCPCRPENGGSGVCGCILGGPKVTC